MAIDPKNFEQLMSYRPNIGYPTAEPCLRDVIYSYYMNYGMGEERSDRLTKQYIEELFRRMNHGKL